ncbi:16525_t:CDS:2 [Dentiscutata erythropus]|uniref:16525_t:CDS:1 n=1 Tax=Dentiscutata erythropus TaxID=1348616 RepID=A0A9N9EA41_9GLOM|nr:16525_t:CDS:2 [Dentiscutata erythropus]
MSRSCPSSNIRTDHFYSAEENNTNANSLSTSCQIYKYCNKDVVNLVDYLKEYLNICNSFSYKLRESTNLITRSAKQMCSQFITNFLDSMPQNDKIILDKKLANFFYLSAILFLQLKIHIELIL